MKTDELITILSQSPKPKKPLSIFFALFLFLIVCWCITYFVLGLRSDLGTYWPDITATYKTVLLLINFILVAITLDYASQPIENRKINHWWFIGLSIGFACSLGLEWWKRDSHEILPLLTWPNLQLCMGSVLFYGMVGVLFLTFLLRHYAPSNENKTATLIGLAAASTGALGYSIHCPVDSPTFILIAYGLPIALIAICARLFAIRFVKW